MTKGLPYGLPAVLLASPMSGFPALLKWGTSSLENDSQVMSLECWPQWSNETDATAAAVPFRTFSGPLFRRRRNGAGP